MSYELEDAMKTARDVVSKWYSDKRHDTTMTGYAQELLIVAIADLLYGPRNPEMDPKLTPKQAEAIERRRREEPDYGTDPRWPR